MDFLVKQGSKYDYLYKEIFCDTESDIVSVNKTACCPGSVLYVIDKGDVYILNNQKEWIIQ